jgi:hypothetical protein
VRGGAGVERPEPTARCKAWLASRVAVFTGRPDEEYNRYFRATASSVNLWSDLLSSGPLPEAKELDMSIPKPAPIEMALEVVVIPVSDVDRAVCT